MKKITKIFSAILITCMLINPISAFAASYSNLTYEEKVQTLAIKYGVTITTTPISTYRIAMSEADEEQELKQLEEHLKAGKAALEENNKEAEAAWQALVSSGRIDSKSGTSAGISPRSTYTVYHTQSIGSYYPNGTTILCYITANRVYSETKSRYLWGSVVSTGSSLYSGYGTNWEETNCETQLIDGGRTEYVQVWGNLEEKYTSSLVEHTITSEGWRLWYEAYCPE